MKTLLCILAVCAAGLSCDRHPDDRQASAPAGPPGTNGLSKVNDNGTPTEKVVYGTNGAVKHRTTFKVGDNGRILSSRTVDAEGNLKWMEEYSYAATGSNRPVEMRRIKPNGEITLVRFSYSRDGAARKIVIGVDGKQIPEAEQEAFLEE